MRIIKLTITLLLAGFGVWVGRLIAHSKMPQPEGRWREVAPEELIHRA